MPSLPTKAPKGLTPTRRTLLKTAAAASLTLAAPITLRAQPVIVRKSLATADSKSDVDTYREAVKFMLTQADPKDQKMFHLNWYRNAMIHLLDCPHGNWWFAVWHRPYLGYFEQKIREVTGNAEFALPFWDWTVQPRIPEAFISDPNSSDPDLRDNPLDPSSSYYVNAPHDQALSDADNQTYAAVLAAQDAFRKAQATGVGVAAARAAFMAAAQAYRTANNALLDHTFPPFDTAYRPAFEAIWNTFNPAQLAQLKTRFGTAPGKTEIDFDWFWRGHPINSVRSNIDWDAQTARLLKWANPDLTGSARAAVNKTNIESSVRSPHFALRADEVGGEAPGYGFNTIEGDTHHAMSRTQAILELQPHNLVHNASGVVMQSNLSSVDPIFFMHHSNVDRVWDVWTRRQMSLTPPRPHLPEHDKAKFDAEEFLFYIHPDGAPVTQDTTAATFMDKARFGYSYADGTGEDEVIQPLLFANVASGRAMPMGTESLAAGAPAAARIALDNEFGEAAGAATATPQAPNILAEITTTLPDAVADLTLEVFVTAQGATPDFSAESPELAGAIGFFGMRGLESHAGHGDDMAGAMPPEASVFDVDITEAVARLTEMGMLEPGAEIDIALNPVRVIGGQRFPAPDAAQLQSVRLKTI